MFKKSCFATQVSSQDDVKAEEPVANTAEPQISVTIEPKSNDNDNEADEEIHKVKEARDEKNEAEADEEAKERPGG